MSQMLLHGGGLGVVDQHTLNKMFRLRHKVFKERLGWHVKDYQGYEIDGFDCLDPVYLLAQYEGQIIGSVRLLRTTGPNMLRDVFSATLGDKPAPCSPLIWESTRFVTDPDVMIREQGNANQITSYLLAGIWEVALSIPLAAIVSVFGVRVGRALRRAGCIYESFGSPTKVGEDLVTAGIFPVSEEVLARIRDRGNLEGPIFPHLCEPNELTEPQIGIA